MSSRNYCAVIGDIVHSRALRDRSVFQRCFMEEVESLNTWLLGRTAAMFVVTTGDEFQGLLHTAGPVYEVLLRVEETLGVRFRLGVGVGRVETAITARAIGMDGPAFHRARTALVRAKQVGPALVFDSGHPRRDGLVNACFSLLEMTRAAWTRRQAEIIRTVQEKETQAEAAKALGISPPAVSQALHAAGWPAVRQARDDLARYLDSCFAHLEN